MRHKVAKRMRGESSPMRFSSSGALRPATVLVLTMSLKPLLAAMRTYNDIIM